jgi:hypothetical protein
LTALTFLLLVFELGFLYCCACSKLNWELESPEGQTTVETIQFKQ